jgi:hypothetical protein
MAFSYVPSPILTQDQASPGHNALKTAMKNYMDMMQASYQKPNLEQALQEKMLKNQYYGPNMESQIGLRGAQTGLYGAQTQGQQIENQFLPEKIQAMIAVQKALAQKKISEANLYNFASNINNFGMQPDEQQNQFQIPYKSNEQQNQNNQNNFTQQQESLMSQQYGGRQQLNPMQQALISHIVGRDIDPQATAMRTGIGSSDAKKISTLDDQVGATSTNKVTLDEMKDLLNDETFQSIRTSNLSPKTELAYWKRRGTPEQREAIGRFQASANKMIVDSAGLFKGPFRTNEQDLLERMKVSEKDTLAEAQGKIKALTYFNEVARQRSMLMSNLMRQHGFSLPEAQYVAEKQISTDKIKSDINDMIHPATEKGLREELANRLSKRRY